MKVSLSTIATTILGSWCWSVEDVVAFVPGNRIVSKNVRQQQDPVCVSSTTDTDMDIDFCIQTLEKRIEEGRGALSDHELSDLMEATARIVEDMKFNEPTPTPTTTSTPTPTPTMEMEVRIEENVPEAEMTEAETDALFWEVVRQVDRAEQNDLPLSAEIPQMLHRIFAADHLHLRKREKISKNITCMQPDEGVGMDAKARKMNYIFDDAAHKDLPLMEGRKCEGGDCCIACSRNIFPTFLSPAECDTRTFPELTSLTFNNLQWVPTQTILQFVRLVERVRRMMSYEYGVSLKTLLPLQAYSRKYVAGTTQQGGGGGEGDFVTLHTDEATHSGYHYSCVLYFNSQDEHFTGGDFVFNDPDPNYAQKKSTLQNNDNHDDEDEYNELDMMSIEEQLRRAGRILTPYSPKKGAAVIFSSGWENMHEVETITSGTRYTAPCFFTTCPVPEEAYEQMAVGKPQSYEDIADDWLHLLLAHRKESPMESVGRVKELLMKWHYMCTPLSEH